MHREVLHQFDHEQDPTFSCKKRGGGSKPKDYIILITSHTYSSMASTAGARELCIKRWHHDEPCIFWYDINQLMHENPSYIIRWWHHCESDILWDDVNQLVHEESDESRGEPDHTHHYPAIPLETLRLLAKPELSGWQENETSNSVLFFSEKG